MGINNVTLIGNLCGDAELKYTSEGTAVAKFSIAYNDYKKEAHFFNCTVWGKLAENLSQYLTKGKQIGIGGELRQNRWEKDGQKRSTVEINVNKIQLLGSKED